MEGATPVRTIGYGARSIDELVSTVAAAGTDHLVDVRSAPYSRFKPEFSKEPLAVRLEREGIRYVFMGDALGGRPDDPSCYGADGRVDYERRRLHPSFQGGIASIEAGWEGGHRIVLMCSEGKPQECHRTKLVAEELVRIGVPVSHIDERGVERTHEAVVESITNGQGALFGASGAAAKSRKKHRAA